MIEIIEALGSVGEKINLAPSAKMFPCGETPYLVESIHELTLH